MSAGLEYGSRQGLFPLALTRHCKIWENRQLDRGLSDLYPLACTCTISRSGEQAYAVNTSQYQGVALHMRRKTEELERLAG